MHSPSPVRRRILNSLIGAEAIRSQSNEQPDGSNYQSNGEEHKIHSWQDKGHGAVLQSSLLGRYGLLGGGKIGQDDVVGEDTNEERRFVKRDVGTNLRTGGGDCGESEGGHDESLESSTGIPIC